MLEPMPFVAREIELTLLTIGVILIAFVVLPSPGVLSVVQAQTQPGIPMIISGNVTLNGSPAPDGLTLTAIVGGEVRGTAILENSSYALEVNGTDSETIDFNLENLTTTQTATFTSGAGILVLNLDFTGNIVQATTTIETTTEVTSTPVPEYGDIGVIIPVALALTLLIVRRKSFR